MANDSTDYMKHEFRNLGPKTNILTKFYTLQEKYKILKGLSLEKPYLYIGKINRPISSLELVFFYMYIFSLLTLLIIVSTNTFIFLNNNDIYTIIHNALNEIQSIKIRILINIISILFIISNLYSLFYFIMNKIRKWNYKKQKNNKLQKGEENKNSLRNFNFLMIGSEIKYIIFIIISLYIDLQVIILILLPPCSIFALIFYIIIFIIITGTSFLAYTFLYIILFSGIHVYEKEPALENYRLTRNLIEALYLSDELNSKKHITIKEKKRLLKLLEYSSKVLKKIEKYLKSQYTLQPLSVYDNLVIYPGSSSFKLIANDLSIYLRAVITNNYRYIPQKKVQIEKKRKNIVKQILFSLYLILPIVIILVILYLTNHPKNVKSFSIELLNFLNNNYSTLYPGYAIWVIVGLRIFIIKQSDSIRDIINDIFNFLKS